MELNPDLILMDIGLPTLNGMEAAGQIRQSLPQARIVFLTQETSAEVVEEALCLRALGYVHKARVTDDLFPAMAAVLRGERFVSSGLDGFGVADGLIGEVQSDLPGHRNPLGDAAQSLRESELGARS